MSACSQDSLRAGLFEDDPLLLQALHQILLRGLGGNRLWLNRPPGLLWLLRPWLELRSPLLALRHGRVIPLVFRSTILGR